MAINEVFGQRAPVEFTEEGKPVYDAGPEQQVVFNIACILAAAAIRPYMFGKPVMNDEGWTPEALPLLNADHGKVMRDAMGEVQHRISHGQGARTTTDPLNPIEWYGGEPCDAV